MSFKKVIEFISLVRMNHSLIKHHSVHTCCNCYGLQYTFHLLLLLQTLHSNSCGCTLFRIKQLNCHCFCGLKK
ncbi:unnamed protein product [Trichobilharzia szidati]|nr:unnamed protein product [Trichobilharzia szidati]